MTIHSVSNNDRNAIRQALHRNPDLAVLGFSSDASSAVFVNDRPGYWWVRPIQAGGTFGPPEQVRGCLQPMYTRSGVPVKLGKVEGEKAVLGPDFVGLLTQGVNPTQAAVVDPNANNPSFVNQASITTAYGQIKEGTLTIAIRGWLILNSSATWVKFDGNIDSTGHVPSSGNHCLAVVAIKSDATTLEIQYSTAKSDGIPLDIDDLNEAWSAMSSPTTNAPLWAFELKDGQTALTEANRWADLRQLINFVMGLNGTVTSIGLSTDASYLTVGSSPITTAGTITLNKTAALPGNQFVGTPDGTTGKADLRSLVNADLPTVNAAHGGTGQTSLTAHNLIVGNGTSAVNGLAPGTARNVAISDGTDWTSRALVAADIPSGGGSPLTTKGDLYTFSTVNARLAVGANNTVLVADSAQTTGNKWTATLTGLTLDNGNTITVKDANFTLQDDGNVTKQLQFQLSGISASTTRTLTAPDASGTIALTSATGQGYVMTAPTVSSDNVITVATTTTRALALKTSDNNTANKLLEILKSDNTVLASIGATGLAVFAGIDNTPIGGTTAAAGTFTALTYDHSIQTANVASGTAIVSISGTATNVVSGPWQHTATIKTNVNSSAMYVQPTFVPTAAIPNFIIGMQFTPQISDNGGSSFNIPSVYGVFARPDLLSTYAGTITAVNVIAAANPLLNGGSGVITTLRGLLVSALSSGTSNIGADIGTITSAGTGTSIGVRVLATSSVNGNASGIIISAVSTSGSGNPTGLSISDITSSGSGTPKAIVTGKGVNTIGDQVTITGWQDVVQLIVVGSSGQASHILNLNSSGGTPQTFVDSGFRLRLLAGSQTTNAAGAGGMLFTDFTDVSNATTTETDLYTHTVKGNTLSTNGDSLYCMITATFANNSRTKQIRLYYAGTVIYDSTAVATAIANAVIVLRCWITRDASGTVKATVVASTNTTMSTVPTYNQVTATNSSDNIWKVTGQVGTGGTTNDILSKDAVWEWLPVAA